MNVPDRFPCPLIADVIPCAVCFEAKTEREFPDELAAALSGD